MNSLFVAPVPGKVEAGVVCMNVCLGAAGRSLGRCRGRLVIQAVQGSLLPASDFHQRAGNSPSISKV